jgi:hypothetical protein
LRVTLPLNPLSISRIWRWTRIADSEHRSLLDLSLGMSATECSCLVDFAKLGVPSLRVSKDARPDSQHTNNTARFFAQKPSSCDMPSELGGDHHMNFVEVTQGSRPRRVMFLVGLAATTSRDKESSVSPVPVVLFFALTSHARVTNLRA